MEAKELRIGNLVMTNFKREEEIIDIKPIDFIENYIKLYKPIPLTEEWLLKFGFEKIKISTSINNLFITYYKKDDIVIYNLQDHFEIELITKFGKQFNLFKVFKKQVHILQNLFFCLTGEELTLNN